jgi:hypothetical protein
MADQTMSIVWIGAGTGLTINRIRTLTGASTILTDLLALSNADQLNTWEGNLTVNSSPAPVNAAYPGLQQVANLVFLCADGSTAQIRLPAPKLSIMLSDGVTVDPASIVTLIADCIGNLESPTGSLAVSFLSGRLNNV